MRGKNSCRRGVANSRRWPWVVRMVLLALPMLSATGPLRAADQKYWELSAYQIQLHLAVDTTDRPQPALAESLADGIAQRVDAVLNPLWSLKIAVADHAERYQLLSELAPLPWEDVPAAQQSADKWMVMSVVAVPEGYRLRCRELDCYTRRWGPVLERTVRQRGMLAEGCFRLLCDVFAPVATVKLLPSDEKRVQLRFKGSELPLKSAEPIFQQPGTVFQPLLRRTDRSGQLLADGILEVPWTYLTLEQLQENLWLSEIHSGSRRPFGVRRRGRTEQLAIAMRGPQAKSKVRFYARHDKSQGLAGYEVYEWKADSQKTRLLGTTDTQGTIGVQPGNTPVTTLLLRSDGNLLAKVPVVPGAVDLLEVPIADDSARMRAQARLTEVRERLIDLVARRNILIARVRDRLADGELNEAQNLMDQLDTLPGRSQFNQVLLSAEKEKKSRSADAKVQARIEKMFADTRSLLGRFLDTRQISELQNQVNLARQGSTPASGKQASGGRKSTENANASTAAPSGD